MVGLNSVSSITDIMEKTQAGTVMLTALAMIAFAANSIICRLALGNELIDPASFSTIRLVSGAAALYIIIRLKGTTKERHPGSQQPEQLQCSYSCQSLQRLEVYCCFQNKYPFDCFSLES
jgi:hypothetical protein